MPTNEERNWAMAAHLGQVVAVFLTAGTLSWLVPLLVWILKREESAFVEEHAKEALNFQITLFIVAVCYSAVAGLMICVFFLGVPMLILGGLAYIAIVLVLGITASLAASRGEHYRYPYTLRLIG